MTVVAGAVTAPGAAPSPVVELRGVGRTFPGPPPVRVLSDVDLVIPEGDYVAVVGPSGSGKSTLLNLLGLLDRPSEGRYLLDGFDVSELGDADRTAVRGMRIGFVFQSFHLLGHRSALENVELAMLYDRTPRRERSRRAAEALDRVGLAHRLGFLPRTMSGGERQRIAIARALVSRPSLLLADEPTGNLDSANSQGVLALFDELHDEGLTVIVITHDPEVAGRAQHTVTMRDGYLLDEP